MKRTTKQCHKPTFDMLFAFKSSIKIDPLCEIDIPPYEIDALCEIGILVDKFTFALFLLCFMNKYSPISIVSQVFKFPFHKMFSNFFIQVLFVHFIDSPNASTLIFNNKVI